ncbi:sel1 repeat family protein [Alphaproteobacteria bacterium]|nr:sel1 repeat family protein [Alphaproteobacteria bacterium]
MKEAADLYFKAAKEGDAEAKNAYGMMLFLGMGRLKNEERGFKWIKQAAQDGYAPAQNNLSIFFEKGMYVKRNMKSAKYWRNLALENGYGKPKDTEVVSENSNDDSSSIRKNPNSLGSNDQNYVAKVPDQVIEGRPSYQKPSEPKVPNQTASAKIYTYEEVMDLSGSYWGPWGRNEYQHEAICGAIHLNFVVYEVSLDGVGMDTLKFAAIYEDLTSKSRSQTTNFEAIEMMDLVFKFGKELESAASSEDPRKLLQFLARMAIAEDCKRVQQPTPISIWGIDVETLVEVLQ